MNLSQQVYQQLGEDIGTWIKRDCKDELGKLSQRYPDEKSSFVVDWSDLYAWNPDLADDAIEETQAIKEAFKTCITDVAPQQSLIDEKREDASGEMEVIRGTELSVKFTNLSDTHSVSELIRGEMTGELVTLRGKCTKATDTRPKLTTAGLRCQNCNTVSKIPQPTHGSASPDQCASCEVRGIDWEPELSESEWEYHQLVRIKHEPGETDSDSHIDVHLTGDHAGSLSGGESVDIVGVLKDIWPDGLDSGSPDFILDADTIRKHDSDFESIDVKSHADRVKALAAGEEGDPYQLLIDSTAPGIHGGGLMDKLKLSLDLGLFGGKRVEMPDGTTFRGDIHQLIVGGPGTGKSSLLDAITEYSPRTARVSGKNASKAGVTAAAVRDDFGDTEWSIEAGAFVQANKGVCLIDELDKVEGDVLSSLHSALERQQLSVAKAGINADLQCQTSLLGACNPVHERFIDEENTIQQIPVGSAMRTRMDAVFCLRDKVDEESDSEKVNSMLNSIASGENVETVNFDESDTVEPPLTKAEIQAWVAYARQYHEVAFDMQRLRNRIGEYYADIRQKSKGSGAPVNIRKVGSILRYSVASARVRLGDRVSDDDIDRAIGIVSTSLAQIGMTDDGEWSSDAGVAEKVNQASRKGRIKKTLRANDELEMEEIDTMASLDEDMVREEIDLLKKKGEVTEPKRGVVRWIEA